MSHPRVTQTLEHKLRKQASLVADVARLQIKEAWMHDSSTDGTPNGHHVKFQQGHTFDGRKSNFRQASEPDIHSVSQLLESHDFIYEMSPAKAFSDIDGFSDGDNGSATFVSIDRKTGRNNEHSAIGATPLNVIELSPSRSHLMSPARIRSSRAAFRNDDGATDWAEKPHLEQHSTRDQKLKRSVTISQKAHMPMPTSERGISSNDSKEGNFSANSVDTSSPNKTISSKGKDRDWELLGMLNDPTRLEEEWKFIAHEGDNIIDVNQILDWLSWKFPSIFDDVSVCKAFDLVASAIGGDSKHLIPRRAFKRLLMAIIWVNRSYDCFSLIASSSNGNPRITFEMFCSVVSKLGSKMDKKRCLFEYQSIYSRTKDHLHIDDFLGWLINSKLMKIVLEKFRPGSASMNRAIKSAVGNKNPQVVAAEQHTSDTVIPNVLFGGHGSTKKYSIGVVPIRSRIDRLNGDAGQDFFRSTLNANLEAQKKLKEERLSNVAKVANDRRLRTLPRDLPTPADWRLKKELHSPNMSSGIARPSFAKMYEFIDSSLEAKLTQMVNDAVLSRMKAGSNLVFEKDQNADMKSNHVNEYSRAVRVSMSPAPQPSPTMHSRPTEYPSPTPQLSDISSFANSPDNNYPSNFSNVALGWQDSMGLPMNMYTENSPISLALRKITDHLHSSKGSAQHSSLRDVFPSEASRQQQPCIRSNEYSEMIQATLSTLSPSSISPRGNLGFGVPRNPADRNASVVLLPVASDNASFAKHSHRSPVFEIKPEISRQPTVRFNLFEAIPEELAAYENPSIPNVEISIASQPISQIREARDAATKGLAPTIHDTVLVSAGKDLEHDVLHCLKIGHINPKEPMPDKPELSRLGPEQPIQGVTMTPRHQKWSPVNGQDDASQSRRGQSSPKLQQGSDAKFFNGAVNDSILRQKQEAILLEEGIESIRGIAELLEMYTSIPSANAASSPKNDTKGEKQFSPKNIGKTDVLSTEIHYAGLFQNATLNRQTFARSLETERMQNLSKFSIEKLPQLLPEISPSPEMKRPNLNIVASILRDALPVKGLDLSQNDSDVDESAISGDDSEGDGDGGSGKGQLQACTNTKK